MDAWSKVGPTSNLCLKRQKKGSFFEGKTDSGRVERDERNFSFSLLSTETGWSESVEPRFKVHLLDEGYAWVPPTCSFTEDFGFGKENLVREALPYL